MSVYVRTSRLQCRQVRRLLNGGQSAEAANAHCTVLLRENCCRCAPSAERTARHAQLAHRLLRHLVLAPAVAVRYQWVGRLAMLVEVLRRLLCCHLRSTTAQNITYESIQFDLATDAEYFEHFQQEECGPHSGARPSGNSQDANNLPRPLLNVDRISKQS